MGHTYVIKTRVSYFMTEIFSNILSDLDFESWNYVSKLYLLKIGTEKVFKFQ